jgi:Fe2+ or Zn2+ uptake regulation protein
VTGTHERLRRGRAGGRWTAADLAGVVEAVLRSHEDRAWSAEDLRDRLAFGRQGGGPALSSVREALRLLTDQGRVERVRVWGRQGWGSTAHAYRAARGPGQMRLSAAA